MIFFWVGDWKLTNQKNENTQLTQIFDCSQARSELCKARMRQVGFHENNNPQLDCGIPTRFSHMIFFFESGTEN